MTIQHQKTPWILLLFLSIAFAACEQQATNENPSILIPADTTQPYLTAAEEAEQKKILLIPYRVKDLWGFADTTGTIRIKPIYKYVERFDNSNLTLVQGQDSMFGLIDKTGKVVEPVIHEWIYVCGNDVFGFQKQGYIELKNRHNKRIDHGQVIATFKHGKEGLNAVQTKEGIGFMDTEGNMVIDDVYSFIMQFDHGVACVAKEDGNWYVINKKGKRVSDLEFYQIFPFASGYGVGNLVGPYPDEHWGVIDSLGNVVIPFECGYISGSFEDDYIACPASDPHESNKPKGFRNEILNRHGKKIAETTLDLGDNFTEGLCVVERGERYGYIDSLGRVAIPIIYEWTGGFKNGLAWVKKNGRYGFIDKQGKVVIPLRYESAYDYVFMEAQGATVVDPETNERFYIDKTGREYRNFPADSGNFVP